MDDKLDGFICDDEQTNFKNGNKCNRVSPGSNLKTRIQRLACLINQAEQDVEDDDDDDEALLAELSNDDSDNENVPLDDLDILLSDDEDNEDLDFDGDLADKPVLDKVGFLHNVLANIERKYCDKEEHDDHVEVNMSDLTLHKNSCRNPIERQLVPSFGDSISYHLKNARKNFMVVPPKKDNLNNSLLNELNGSDQSPPEVVEESHHEKFQPASQLDLYLHHLNKPPSIVNHHQKSAISLNQSKKIITQSNSFVTYHSHKPLFPSFSTSSQQYSSEVSIRRHQRMHPTDLKPSVSPYPTSSPSIRSIPFQLPPTNFRTKNPEDVSSDEIFSLKTPNLLTLPTRLHRNSLKLPPLTFHIPHEE